MNQKLLPFIAIALLGLASAFFIKASVFALLLIVIAFAALPRLEHQGKAAIFWLLVASSLATTVGMLRFIWDEALPGIAEARGRASSKRAVSLLRELLFAQDAARRYGMIDPDGDGVGSAARLGELTGFNQARGQETLPTPPLDLRYSPRVLTRSGPATEQNGYLLLICLPGRSRPWVSLPLAPVDEEAAETRWIAYAWPAHDKMEHRAAYFIDEHERILESKNLQPAARGKKSPLRLVGPGLAPDCGDVFDHETSGEWEVWAGKEPRSSLPGAPGKL